MNVEIGFLPKSYLSMPIITLQKDSTMFWVCYDGSSVISISNDNLFSTSDSIINSFPPGVKGIEFEYEE